MLTKLIALKQLQEAKRAARKEALEAIDAEFGDVDAMIEAERAEIMRHMKENNLTYLVDGEGIVEIRRSRPKYDVVDDKALITWLYDNQQFDILGYKKADVNTLAALGQIPDTLINVITDEELVVRTQ